MSELFPTHYVAIGPYSSQGQVELPVWSHAPIWVQTTVTETPRKPQRIPRSWIRARRRRGVTLIELLVWGAVIWLVFSAVML